MGSAGSTNTNKDAHSGQNYCSTAQVVTERVRKEVYLMFEYLRSFDKILDWSAESAFVRNCLAPLGSEAFSREEVIYFVPLAVYPEFHSLVKAIVSEGLRRDPKDPRFRMYSVLGRHRSPLDFDLAKVEKIYHDATRQGDIKTAEIAKCDGIRRKPLLSPP